MNTWKSIPSYLDDDDANQHYYCLSADTREVSVSDVSQVAMEDEERHIGGSRKLFTTVC